MKELFGCKKLSIQKQESEFCQVLAKLDVCEVSYQVSLALLLSVRLGFDARFKDDFFLRFFSWKSNGWRQSALGEI